MELPEIFGTTQSVNISIYTLIIIGAIIIGIVFFLVGVILYLVKRIKILTKVRFGFGGKPLFSLLILFGVIVAIPLTMYAAQHSVDLIKLARAERDVIVEFNVAGKTDGVYEVVFIAVPTLDGEAWLDKSYTVTWYIQGEVTLEKVEKDRNRDAPSYFVTDLPSGTYKVKVTVESEGFSIVKVEELTLE
jgi:energy-coupling factor transporter transmembrane protein EcfT